MTERIRTATLKNGDEVGYRGGGTSSSPIDPESGANMFDLGEIVWKSSREKLENGDRVFIVFNSYLFSVDKGRGTHPDEFYVFFHGIKDYALPYTKSAVDTIVTYSTCIQAGLIRSFNNK